MHKRIKLLLAIVVILAFCLISIVLTFIYLLSQSDSTSDNELSVDFDNNGCLEFEEYDQETDECVYYCESDEECEQIEKFYDNLFADDYSDYSLENLNSDKESSQEDENIIASYDIDDNKTLISNNKDHLLLWNFSTKLFDNIDAFDMVNQFTIFSDGKDETLAYVEQTSDDLSTWTLGIDIEDFVDQGKIINDKDLTATLIHELSHIISLNNLQIDAFEDNALCNTLYIDEGCLANNSYLYDFYNNFWKGQKYNDFQTALNSCDDEAECKELEDFYYQYEDHFVTDYASTNIVEDIAESFTYFVITPNNMNTENISYEKVKFFNNYDYFNDIRLQLRVNSARKG
jgi:hypothetical protein